MYVCIESIICFASRIVGQFEFAVSINLIITILVAFELCKRSFLSLCVRYGVAVIFYRSDGEGIFCQRDSDIFLQVVDGCFFLVI